MRYAFVREHEDQYPVRRRCKVMALHPSGYYAWRTNPKSKCSIEDRRLLRHIKQSWLESGAVYGYRKVLVRDRRRQFKPQAFLCTDQNMTPVQIHGWIVRRW